MKQIHFDEPLTHILSSQQFSTRSMSLLGSAQFFTPWWQPPPLHVTHSSEASICSLPWELLKPLFQTRCYKGNNKFSHLLN